MNIIQFLKEEQIDIEKESPTFIKLLALCGNGNYEITLLKYHLEKSDKMNIELERENIELKKEKELWRKSYINAAHSVDIDLCHPEHSFDSKGELINPLYKKIVTPPSLL